MTKTELARLVRIARFHGYLRINATLVEMYCPADIEAKDRYDRTVAHRFAIPHLPWEKGTTVAEVTRALADHLDPGAEECAHAGPGI